MKALFIAAAMAFSVRVHCAAVSTKRSFGPQNCVALTRSSAGSCVISTDCEGADLSQTEFAFDCVKQSGDAGIVRHSFGTGGFDNSEEFDTEVKCDRCESPSAADVVVKPAAQPAVVATPSVPLSKATAKVEVPVRVPAAVIFKAKHRHSVKAEAASQGKAQFWPFTSGATKKKEEPEVVKYGPNGCVSTWKNDEDHCIIKTDCAKDDMSKYEFGLICVDKVGSPVRHLFGRDSFDGEETFDTLIKCNECLGLEDIPDAVALNGEVVTLSKDIAQLQAVMKNITINVKMLNDEVFKSAPAPAPAAAASGPAVASLVHHSTDHRRITGDQIARKHNLRHPRKHHHERRDDDDDESADDRDDRVSDVQDAVTNDDEEEGEDYDADDED